MTLDEHDDRDPKPPKAREFVRHAADEPPWVGKARDAAVHAIDRVLKVVAQGQHWLEAHAPKGGYHGDGRPRRDRR